MVGLHSDETMIFYSEVHGGQPENPVLLLIHGMGSNSSTWKPILQELTPHFTVITVDLPGHGATRMNPTQKMDPESLALSIFETVKELGFQNFHLVGNSLGGWIALEMAALQPDSILSVVGLAPAGLWLTPFTSRYPGGALAKTLARTLKPFTPLLMRFEWARRIAFRDVSPTWRAFPYDLCLDATQAMAAATGYYPAWEALRNRRFDGGSTLNLPITVLFGDSDKTLPALTCQERTLLPSYVNWITLEKCGHAPMWDHPGAVIAEIMKISSRHL